MSKLLSLARFQDHPGRCGTAATPRPPQAAAIRCKERKREAGRPRSEYKKQLRGYDWRGVSTRVSTLPAGRAPPQEKLFT